MAVVNNRKKEKKKEDEQNRNFCVWFLDSVRLAELIIK